MLVKWNSLALHGYNSCFTMRFLILADVRGERARKEYAILVRRHRAACIIQQQIKCNIAKKEYLAVRDASIVIQSGNVMYAAC